MRRMSLPGGGAKRPVMDSIGISIWARSFAAALAERVWGQLASTVLQRATASAGLPPALRSAAAS